MGVVCRSVVHGVDIYPPLWMALICIHQGHPMSRPAFSPPQFRSPIQSTRHTHLINRPPAAEACRASLPVKDAEKRLVDSNNMLLLLLLVTAASGLMSGDTCNFPLTELGLVDTCNLTTDVDAYQVILMICLTVANVLGSTVEIQHWSQLSLARGSPKRCRQHGEFSILAYLFSLFLSPLM